MAYELEDEHNDEEDRAESKRDDLLHLLRERREDDLPDDLPTYEELAFNHEWMEELEDEPFPEPEPVRTGYPYSDEKKRQERTGTAIVTFMLIVAIAWLSVSILHQQYNAGYGNGSRDGAIASYQAGASQAYNSGIDEGEQKALVGLQEWQYSHKCAVDTQGFVLFKMSRDNENRYQFECVQQK